MTTIEHDRIEADSGWTDRRPPTLQETAAPLPLSGMRLNPQLSLCNEYEWPYSNCPLPKFWLSECDPAFPADGQPDKCTSTEWNMESFRPFKFYDLESTPCVDPLIDPQRAADNVVSESTVWAVTTVLQNGGGATTATLQSTATDLTPTSGTAVDPVEGVAKLVRAMALRGIGRYTLHAPIWTLPILETSGLVRSIGGVYRTTGNVPVNLGIGLTGQAPDASDPVVNTDEAAYLYVTRGPVEYNLGAVTPFSPAGTIITPRMNTAAAESIRQGIVAFDAGCTYAIKICLKKVSCCA